MPKLSLSTALVAYLCLAGCHTTVPEGVYPCTNPGHASGAPECPTAWYCRIDSRCWSSPDSVGDAGADASTAIDAPISDAPACMPSSPASEVCDGIDNDCDGTVDGVLASEACGAQSGCVQARCVPRYRWGHRFVNGGGGTSLGPVTADERGNVYVVGQVDSTDLGRGALSSHGSIDWLVASFDQSGGLQWQLAAGGAGADFASAVAVGGDQVFVAGWFRQTAYFGPTLSLTTSGASGEPDVGVAALDRDTGMVRWARQYPTSKIINGPSVDVTSGGDIVLAGVLRDAIDLDGMTVGTAGVSSALVFSLAANGSRRWARAIPMVGMGYAATVLDDTSAALAFTVGPAALDVGLGSPIEGGPIALVSVDLTDGHVTRAGRFGSSADTTVSSLRAYGDEICFGGGQQHADFGTASGNATYIACLDSTTWTMRDAASWAQLAASLVDSDEVIPYFSGSNFGTTAVDIHGVSIDTRSFFVGAAPSLSSPLWLRAFGGHLESAGASTRARVLTVVGTSDDATDWGGGTMAAGVVIAQFDL